MLNTGHYQEAVEKFSQAIALSAENSAENSVENSVSHYNPALYYARRGFAYVQLSKDGEEQNLNYSSEYAKQASRDFDRAIELSPELAITYIHYGYLKTFEEKYDKAIESYEKAIEKGVKYYIVYANIAEAYFKWAQFKKSTGIIADNTDAIQNYEKSIENYEEAIKLEDKRPETFFNLAVAYYISGNIHKASGNIHKATEKASESNKMLDKIPPLESSISSSPLKIQELKIKVSAFLDTLQKKA